MPAAAPRAKLVQIAASGADVRPIPGTRQDVTEAALAAIGESFYASHNWQPFFIEGTKTLAFELWEQLGFRVPDNILVPTGYGSNILGLDRGFDELERAREIAARPRLFAVQAANCAAFAAAWAAGADRFRAVRGANRPSPTGSPPRSRSASPRSWRRCVAREAVSSRSPKRRSRRRSPRSAVSGCLSSPQPRPPARR